MARGPGSLGARALLAASIVCAGCAGTKPRQTGGGAGGSRDGGGGGAANGADATLPVIGGSPLGDAACATQTQQAQRAPLDIYMMLDSSGSMADATAAGPTKWDAVRAALTAFLQDSQSAGLGVGVQYFPLLRPNVPGSCTSDNACNGFGPCALQRTCDTGGTVVSCTTNADCNPGVQCIALGACSIGGQPSLCGPLGGVCTGPPANLCAAYCEGRDRCDAPSYATPAVEVAALPGARAALVASLNQHVVDGLTATAGGLSGAISHAQALARANPTHRVVTLLATDGFPDECPPNDNVAGVAAIAAAGLAGTPSIATFVIGVFTPAEQADAQTNLDAMAAAGGTGRAFVINTNQNVTQQFQMALNAIRTTGLSCQYEVPAAPAGGTLDYFSVNVQFTSGAGQAVTIGNVASRAACSPTKGGWYYDVDPTTGAKPTTINICDTSCTQLRADTAGRVDILIGCKTQMIVP